jgi:hypothetical protein
VRALPEVPVEPIRSERKYRLVQILGGASRVLAPPLWYQSSSWPDVVGLAEDREDRRRQSSTRTGTARGSEAGSSACIRHKHASYLPTRSRGPESLVPLG